MLIVADAVFLCFFVAVVVVAAASAYCCVFAAQMLVFLAPTALFMLTMGSVVLVSGSCFVRVRIKDPCRP